MMDRTDRHERFFLRKLSKKAYLYTEMIHINAILHGDKNKLLSFNPCEYPLAIQLGGNDPYKISEAASISEDYGYDEVNLNIGCPSNRVQGGGFGAVLMKDPKLVSSCIKSVKKKIKIPVSIKCRIGVDDMDEYKDLNLFIEQASDAGCKIFIIHARKAWLKGLSPKDNRNLPPLNYERVYRVKEEFPDLEIILNGGIEEVSQCNEHLEFVDGVMMGRKAYDNPYQMIEVDSLFFGLPKQAKTRKEIFLDFIPYIMKQISTGEKIHLITRHLMGLSKGIRNAKEVRTHLANLNTFDEPEENLYQIANQLT